MEFDLQTAAAIESIYCKKKGYDGLSPAPSFGDSVPATYIVLYRVLQTSRNKALFCNFKKDFYIAIWINYAPK